MNNDLAGGLRDIQQLADDLQCVFGRAQALAPARAEGADPTGSVRVELGSDGWPIAIHVGSGWAGVLPAESVGAAVEQAFATAQTARMAAWSDAMRQDPLLDMRGPIGASAPTRWGMATSRVRLDGQPRPIDELAEDMISAVAELVHGPAARSSGAEHAGVGSVASGRLVLSLGAAAGLTCMADPQWVAQQTAARLSDALGAALLAARSAVRDGPPTAPVRNDRLDLLLADALAVLDECARPSNGQR